MAEAMMAFVVGVVLAFCIGVFGSVVRLDRERGFYPTVMIVIALLYALFAAIGGSASALALEAMPITVFVAASVLGFKRSLWFVVGALVGHGLFDAIHGLLISNPGVPAWWPAFCSAYDVVAGLYLAWLLKSNRVPAGPPLTGVTAGLRASAATKF
jgi:hypothetical protein